MQCSYTFKRGVKKGTKCGKKTVLPPVDELWELTMCSTHVRAIKKAAEKEAFNGKTWAQVKADLKVHNESVQKTIEETRQLIKELKFGNSEHNKLIEMGRSVNDRGIVVGCDCFKCERRMANCFNKVLDELESKF